jgi:hypothetical protein
MGRALKTVALVLGVTAVALLFIFGFAIWVFIPLLPAIIVYLIAAHTVRRTRTLPATELEHKRDKAA